MKLLARALRILLASILLAACASAPGVPAIAPDLGIAPAADQSLPPAFWPENPGVEFLDQAGNCVVFGLPCLLRGPVVLEDGSVVAAALDLGRGLFSMGGIRFRPEPGAEAGSGRVVLEWRGAPGFLLSISDWVVEKGKLYATGSLGLRASAEEALPGQASVLEAALSRVQLGRHGPLWTGAAIGALSMDFSSAAATDRFSATEAFIHGSDRAPSLSCALTMPDAGSLTFTEASISPAGDIVFGKASEGSLEAALPDGSSLRLTGIAALGEGLWSAEGEAVLPADIGGATVFFREESLGLQALSPSLGSGKAAASSIAITEGAWKLTLTEAGLSFSPSGLSLEAPASSLNYGGFDLPVGALKRPVSGPATTAGERFSSMMLPLAAGGFRATSASFDGKLVYLAGSLSFPPGFPASDMAVDGLSSGRDMVATRLGNLKPLSFRAFSADWSVSGLELGTDWAVLRGLEGALGPLRRMKLESFSLDLTDTEAAAGSAASGTIEGFATRSDLTMRDIRWSRGEGFRAAGRAMIEFVVSSQVFRRALEVKELSLDAHGKLSVLSQDWPESPVHAFLGLVFQEADFDFRDGKPYILLSRGSFEKGGILPSGGGVDGLGMDIAARSYDRGSLAFSSAASLSWRGALFTLEGFDSVLDDDYAFSGSVVLPPVKGSSWKTGEPLRLSSLRLNGYGEVIAALALYRGRNIDLMALLPPQTR